MSKTSIVIIIYIIGLIFGALVLKIWSADTSVLKGLLGLGWTAPQVSPALATYFPTEFQPLMYPRRDG